MNFKLTINPIEDIKADIEIIIISEKNLDHRFVQDKELLEKSGFKSSQDETCLLIERDRLYVAVENISSINVRTAIATAIRVLANKSYKSIKIASYMNHPKCTTVLRGMVEGFVLGAYVFDRYKSEKSKLSIEDITISLDEYNEYQLDIEACTRAMNNGEIVANATNFTRDIVNTPPDDCYPKVMAKIAKNMAKENGLECIIIKPKELKKEKMETLLAVARASRHKPRVIHLAHKPENPKAIVTLVGKGLTYDSGGLSLKPSDFMVTMKSDKSGGSAVIGIMKAISEMNLPVEVHGFIGAVENMIGGDAYKPDDVLVAKNGKTIEIRNTDAEGRLVLADTLCYAQQEVKADYIFDMATLTGASVVGVGHYTSTIMGNSDKVKDSIIKYAKISGEFATKLDFNRYLKKSIKSEIADICNISNTRYGGAITAGQFLENFIDDDHKDKWVHIDIAGPAFVEHSWGENPHGASGAGVRMMTRFIEGLARPKK
ncbi:leucyl aminopeptidase [Sulfurovum sp. bin170]|uniref:leucyl aminopeptidase n=1 Tax=Sulfurovum sp. bin170 TaxID=2695268 RepID=UPI0013DF460F|nr:leucyl aminopeptidase [Sulfurovum sp. bin170]NEW60974.1 leucyl aminopeptidase [Sulfurovum sp. bin170]